MTDKPLAKLPCDTVRLIGSSQVITSVSTAVKELVENSLDAGAKNIQVRLENFGLSNIEVKDDGHGMSYNSVAKMFLHGYTSKIQRFSDLDELQSYGFRGEALAALCNLSKITITTKTTSDTLAMSYMIDFKGNILSSKPSHLNKGTIISVANLFNNLPVRKQYLSSKKRMSDELKKVEQVVQSLSVVHTDLRLSLIHNQSTIWQKNSVGTLKQSFMQVIGLRSASKMEYLNEIRGEIALDLIVPRKGLEDVQNLFSNVSNSVYVNINRRPVVCKEISKVLMEHIFLHYSNLNPSTKYVISLVSVLVLPNFIDVNLEPNKTRVLLRNLDEIITIIDDVLSKYYGHRVTRPEKEESFVIAEEEEKSEYDECSLFEDPAPKKQKLNHMELETKAVTEVFAEKKNSPKKINLDESVEEVIPASQSRMLCSQINSENCVLTTEEEVTELNTFLSENSKLVTSVNNFASDFRAKERGEIQSNLMIPETSSVMSEVPKERDDISRPYSKDCEVEFINTDISSKEWSKGVVKIDDQMLRSGAVLLQPPVLDTQESQSSQEPLSQDVAQFDFSMQSISSQMGKKEFSSFTKFSKIMRPKILQEYPNILFTKVAGLLVERWNELTLHEKRYYERLAKTVDDGRKAHQEQKKCVMEQQPLVKQKKEDCNESVQDIFRRLKQKVSQRPSRKEVTIHVSFEKILQLRNQKITNEEAEIVLLGQLRPSGNWIYKKGTELGHVRHGGLQELIVSERMLSSHSVSRKEVEKRIYVTEDILGSNLWKILLSLETEYDEVTCRHVITDSVITKNGFQIEIDNCEQTGAVAAISITQVAATIPHYGLNELRDTLGKFEKFGESSGLRGLRPTAIQNYITNEAIRMSQQAPRPPDRSDLQNYLETWEMYLKHLPPKCLHGRDIFLRIYDLSDAR